MMRERKYQLTKVTAGDWLLPSNDAQTLWRIRFDGTWWSLLAFSGDADFDEFDRADIHERGKWTFVCGLLHTRTEAINKALSYGEPDHEPDPRKEPRMNDVSSTPSEDHYTCPAHDVALPMGTECDACNAFLDNPPDPAAMTGADRRAELDRWGERLTVKFSRMHERIEALVGRPVWTHEMASSNFPNLLTEAESWSHPDDLTHHAVNSLVDIASRQRQRASLHVHQVRR